MQLIRNHSAESDLPDVELLERYKRAGDLTHLGALYARYMALVYGVCVKYLKNEQQAKDAVMDIFESLIAKLKVHEVQNFKSWLHVLTKNHCLMQLRKGAHFKIISSDDENFMQSDEVSHHAIEEPTQEQVFVLMEKCLEVLNAEQRKTVQLFYLEEKCYQEVAAITGYELTKVRSYIQNGRRNLKICMEKNTVE